MMRRDRLIAAAGIALLAPASTSIAFAETAGAADPPPTDVVVTAQRLDQARASIQPDIGASTYTITKEAISAIPGGENLALDQVVLQMPGVSQDSFGQLHVRDDHNNIQFRLNGVILPEGISVFGQALSPRIIESVKLITGALPAEYGLRTAGVLNITTKSGVYDNGGTVGVYGGSHGEIEPSFTYGGSVGGTNFFVSGSFLQSQLGIESPDGSSTPDHDRTQQIQGFAYLDHTFGANDRLSLILGTSQEYFQIPETPGQQPSAGLTVNGVSAYPSEALGGNQRETTDYAVASWLHAEDRWSSEVSLYGRYSSLTYRPARNFGELLYNGISQGAAKGDTAFGLQAEGVYKLTPSHTLRSGVILSVERGTSSTLSYVLPVDDTGAQTTDTPLAVADRSGKNQYEYSFYVQDEWRLLSNLTLNYGVRLDEVNAYVNEGQVSPRVNLVWEPTSTLTAHVGYSRYFTPPPFELIGGSTLGKFQNTTAAPEVAVDDTPRSERADYYDVGAEQKFFGKTLTLGVDGYYRQSTHLIDEGQFGAPIILTPFNYATAHLRGVELTANYVLGDFSAYANLAWERAQGRDIQTSEFNFGADDLAYITNHYIYLDHDQTYTGSAGAAYRFRTGLLSGLRLSGDLIYGSGLRADLQLPSGMSIPNGAHLPAYTQVNLSAVDRVTLPALGPLELRFDVVNAADKVYEIRNGTGVGVGAPQFGPRRGFFVGVTRFF